MKIYRVRFVSRWSSVEVYVEGASVDEALDAAELTRRQYFPDCFLAWYEVVQ
jgi:hypothetical protein